MSWDESNTFNLLKGLYSLSYLERNGDTFCNMPETSKYLVKGKPAYMGLPEYKSIHKILDLGCGAGCLGIAVIQDVSNRTRVLFDRLDMQSLIEETVRLSNMQDSVSIKIGDFIKDDIDSGYDLILCSSIMLFAIAGGANFFAKLKKALNPGEVVVCLNEGVEPDYSGPWDMILGYMAFNLQGMPIGVIKGQITEAAKAGGFNSVENCTILLSTGTHDINILRK